MSLPTLSSGSLSTTRKSGWRWLPEIHASRLSVSGSLRPKLGLLILSILLLISLCFVLVPVLSKLKLTSSSSITHRDLPLQRLYNELSLEPERTVLLTPEIISTATVILNSNSTWCGSPLSSVSQVINSSAVVFLNKDHGHPFSCNDHRIRVVETQFGTEVLTKSLEKELGGRETLDYNELKQITRSVIITKSWLTLPLPGVLRNGNLIISGLYQVVIEKDRTIVKINNLEADLELFLIQAHGSAMSDLTSSLTEMSQFGRSQVQVVLPTQVLHSSLSLSSKLNSLGTTAQGSHIYHLASLRFIPQANTVRADDQETPSVTRLVLLEHFTFLLRQRETQSVIMFGNVFPKSA